MLRDMTHVGRIKNPLEIWVFGKCLLDDFDRFRNVCLREGNHFDSHIGLRSDNKGERSQ